jgi:heme/copper-type cytochrome/quinol oxidase subunit 2
MSIGIVFWLVIAAIAISGIYFRHKAGDSRNQVLKTMIEKGQPIPDDLFDRQTPMDGQNLMIGGIVLISIGVAMVIFFGAMSYYGEFDDNRFVPFVSAFPFCVGIALLICARLIKKHD